MIEVNDTNVFRRARQARGHRSNASPMPKREAFNGNDVQYNLHRHISLGERFRAQAIERAIRAYADGIIRQAMQDDCGDVPF